jgi:tetratricopeptide (TPR) repeat protein
MQSFRYQLPLSPRGPRRPAGRPWRAIAAAAAALGLGAGLWWGVPASGLGNAVGALLVRPAGAAERDRQAETLLAEGAGFMARGDWRAAVSRFDAALALGASGAAYRQALDARYLLASRGEEAPPMPALATTAIAEGRLAWDAKRLDAALAAFDEAARLAPSDARAHLGRARVLEAQERFDEALAAYVAAQASAPEDAAVTEALLAMRAARGDAQRALAQAVETYRLRAGRTDDEALHIGLLDAYQRQGLTPAELGARHAIDAPQLSPAARDYFLARAAMRHYRRNPHWNAEAFEQVLAACRRVLATEGAAASIWRGKAGALLAEAYEARAQRFLARSDFDAARVQFARALEHGRYLTPAARARLHVQLARLLPTMGRPEGAVPALEAALKLDPANACSEELARWHGHLGVELLAAGKAHEAVKPLKRALAVAPDSAPLLARLHQALKRTGHHAPLTAAAQAAKLPLADARVRLAEGLLAIGRPADAAQAAEAAGRAGVGAGALAEVRAELALARGQRHAARQALTSAIARHPSAEGHQRLGEIDAALARAAKPAERPALWLRARGSFAQSLALGGGDRARGHLLAQHKQLAESALSRRDHATARRLAAEGLLLAPHNPALSLLHGQALAALGEPAAARAAYASGLLGLLGSGEPVAARLHDRLGHLLLAERQHSEAIQAFQAGLAPDASASPPICASLYYGLTMAHWASGQRAQAVEAGHQYLFWSFHDPLEATRVPEVQQLESRLAAR